MKCTVQHKTEQRLFNGATFSLEDGPHVTLETIAFFRSRDFFLFWLSTFTMAAFNEFDCAAAFR